MICEPFTNLDGAKLAGADLRGADISCVEGITVEQLRSAIIDETTMVPPGLEHLVRPVPTLDNFDDRSTRNEAGPS